MQSIGDIAQIVILSLLVLSIGIISLPIVLIMFIVLIGMHFNIISENATKSGFMLFMLATFIIGTICLIINFICVLDFKWHIDYFVSKNAVCEKLRWTAFEVESIRYNFAAFLKGKKFESIQTDFINTYSIVTVALGLLISLAALLLLIQNKSKLPFGNSTIEKLEKQISEHVGKYYWIIFATVPMLIIFITVTSKYKTNFDEIQADSSLNAYYNVYKIVSTVMVLSGMKDVELKYALEGLGKDTLDNILEKNIASYEEIYISSKVKEIKQEAYKNLDFLKYLVFDKYSPYYLPYFDNIYMRHKMAENRFLEDLYLKYDKKKTAPIRYISDIQGQFSNNGKLYTGTDQTLKNIEKDFTNKVNKLNTEITFENIYTNYNHMKQFLNEMNTALVSNVPKLESDLYTYAKEQFNRTDVKAMNEYVNLNMDIRSMLESSGAKLEGVTDHDYIKYYIEHKEILTSETKLDDVFKKIKEQSNYAYMYYVYLSIIFLLVSHYIFNITDRSTYIYILGAILITYILFMWVYTQLSFLA
jgi:hypothetical protein